MGAAPASVEELQAATGLSFPWTGCSLFGHPSPTADRPSPTADSALCACCATRRLCPDQWPGDTVLHRDRQEGDHPAGGPSAAPGDHQVRTLVCGCTPGWLLHWSFRHVIGNARGPSWLSSSWHAVGIAHAPLHGCPALGMLVGIVRAVLGRPG